MLGEFEQPTICGGLEGLSAATSNFHPTLGYAPPQPYLEILVLTLRHSSLRICSAASGSVETDEKSDFDVGHQREACQD